MSALIFDPEYLLELWFAGNNWMIFQHATNELDRTVVVKDQIRTIIHAFRDRLFTEIYPGRTEVPKTQIFAKDDSHADDIVQIVRGEFGKGNDAQKITYTGTARVVNKTRRRMEARRRK